METELTPKTEIEAKKSGFKEKISKFAKAAQKTVIAINKGMSQASKTAAEFQKGKTDKDGNLILPNLMGSSENIGISTPNLDIDLPDLLNEKRDKK